MRTGLTLATSVLLVAGGLFVACGGSSRRSGFDEAPPVDEGDGGAPSLVNGTPPPAGLAGKRVACSDANVTTTLTGKVYDPAGSTPLYNVAVYIPDWADANGTLEPFPEGVQCTTCASTVNKPLVSTLTNTKGEFKLENVPVDKDVPVIVQVGKWRRKLTFDITKSCEENKVPDREFRLPKNGQEGDMPQIAVTAGSCDSLECLLRGVGLDQSEFVAGHGGTGHVHVFNGQGGNFPGAPSAGGPNMGGDLWNDATKMAKYDVLLLSCECDEYNDAKGGTHPMARQAMFDYINMGGRVFASHYHYTWFRNSPQGDFKGLAQWSDNSFNGYKEATVETSFPKGQAMADWLTHVNGSPDFDIVDPRSDMTAVNSPATTWIVGRKPDRQPRYFSFNAPVSAPSDQQCGRGVFGSLHLMGSGSSSSNFPTGCPAPGGLATQQKVLEFLFFDLSACVSSDSEPPPQPK